MRAPAAWLALLLLMLTAAPAGAQGPACASVEVAVDGGGPVSVEGPATFRVTVTNGGQATGTPLDQPADVRLSVSGVPEGWTASLREASLDVLPGESVETALAVAVSTAADASEAQLTVTAVLSYGLPDLLGDATGCTDTAAATVDVARDEPLTREVLETVGAWIYVILGALVLAVLMAAKLAVDARRTAVVLAADNQFLHLRPGARGTVQLRVENVSRRHDRVGFHLSVVPEGWQALLPLTEVELEPGDMQELFLQVATPADATPGDLKAITVIATSRVAPRRPASAVVEIQVDPAAPDTRS